MMREKNREKWIEWERTGEDGRGRERKREEWRGRGRKGEEGRGRGMKRDRERRRDTERERHMNGKKGQVQVQCSLSHRYTGFATYI